MRWLVIALATAAVAMSACGSVSSSPTGEHPKLVIAGNGTAADVQQVRQSIGSAPAAQSQRPTTVPVQPAATPPAFGSAVPGTLNPDAPAAVPLNRKCAGPSESAPTCASR